MNTQDVLQSASAHLHDLSGVVFDLVTVSRPDSISSAANLAKIISKLSPLVGNMIEFSTVDYLNTRTEYRQYGEWSRQDPGFPDAIFEGSVEPTPGFEIKAWFPLATEITARFKDSQDHFAHNQTFVCLLAWLPEHVISGKPQIIDVSVVPGKSVAEARDQHYHNPPDYLVIEPEDTSMRTSNLQQSNTNGYKFQGSALELDRATELSNDWGLRRGTYQTSRDYQGRLRELQRSFDYRLDTNFAKMDRIRHPEIENFKQRVLETDFHGMAIKDWYRNLYRRTDEENEGTLSMLVGNQTNRD